MSYPDQHWSKVWQGKRTKLATVTSSGCVFVERIRTKTTVGTFHIALPGVPSPEFHELMQTVYGRWRHRSGVWTVPYNYLTRVLLFLDSTYGRNKVVLKGFGDVRLIRSPGGPETM